MGQLYMMESVSDGLWEYVSGVYVFIHSHIRRRHASKAQLWSRCWLCSVGDVPTGSMCLPILCYFGRLTPVCMRHSVGVGGHLEPSTKAAATAEILRAVVRSCNI